MASQTNSEPASPPRDHMSLGCRADETSEYPPKKKVPLIFDEVHAWSAYQEGRGLSRFYLLFRSSTRLLSLRAGGVRRLINFLVLE